MFNNEPNRLVNEKSPYLYQHAHNPVDWFPWGEEAFEKARSEDKPVFLSIGYSTCHWCHVMERESFCDHHVAELLNTHFVSVKVDREERPDVDSVYMSVCQALTGSGGWPLTILMTPEKKPFYAGTYLTRDDMSRLLTRMNDLWSNSRRDLIDTGEEIQRHINYVAASDERISSNDKNKETAHALDGDTVLKAVEIFTAYHDDKYGGFGSAPKFPAPHNLLFLLEYDRLSGSTKARKMVQDTLASMYRGGIFDHIAGGFSRYSTDDKWLVPHFEKMLYDNALLAWTYLIAYELYHEEFYKTAAQKIFSWAFAELRHDNGGFYCGQDADSDGVEGKYYLFGYDEIAHVIGEENAERYRKHYGVTKKGDYEGKNILNLIRNSHFGDDDEFINECNRDMYKYRRNRTRLHTDDKVLTAWNSLMIIALVKAYEVLGDESYLESAKETERFISDNMSFAGRLYVRWREGEVFGNGKLDDYAAYSLALLNLYHSTDSGHYLDKAEHYTDVMVQHFFDFSGMENVGEAGLRAESLGGGFYFYADDDEQLISRPKEIYDGALPSGNSMAFMVLDILRRESGDPKWSELYKRQSRFVAGHAGHYPTGCAFSLITVLNESVKRSCQGGKCD